MKSAGIDVEEYYYTNWGRYHNESMFARQTKHASNVSQSTLDDKIAFYAQFYNRELARNVISAFHTDYQTFKFPYPQWVDFL